MGAVLHLSASVCALYRIVCIHSVRTLATVRFLHPMMHNVAIVLTEGTSDWA